MPQLPAASRRDSTTFGLSEADWVPLALMVLLSAALVLVMKWRRQ